VTDDGANILAAASGLVRSAHHWCHGVAGYLWCLAQAFEHDTALSSAVAWATEAFVRSAPLVDNPTYCHGVAGTLETWRILMSSPSVGEITAHRVSEAIAVLRALQRRDGGGVVWSSEDPLIVTPDLWVGFLGPATALALRQLRTLLLSPEWLADQRVRPCASRAC
jgi:Lanthionine synthetase C-like protein